MTGRSAAGVRALAAVAAVLAVPSTAAASLPKVESGHRPGPDALYAPPPSAPQLENIAPWEATPLLVSGAAAYREGEFLYQDFLYDDHGAQGIKDPEDPHTLASYLFSSKTGTLTYPTDPAFVNNAADLVELRIRPLSDATAFRVTLNSLGPVDRTAFTIALGGSGETRNWPHRAGVRSPAELFLTVHGRQAELTDAVTGRVITGATVSLDEPRRQFDVRVPHTAWNPRRETVRIAAGTGIWDPAAGRYSAPSLTASATTPGGGRIGTPSLFNMAFRFAEPKPDVTQGGLGVTIVDAAAGALVEAAWWRERAQANALASGDVSALSAAVDFGKLADRSDADYFLPRTGAIDRIFASRHVFGQGVDYEAECGGVASATGGALCTGPFVGQLQPYALYIPQKARPAAGFGFTLLLHSLGATYNQYTASRNQSQLGDRADGSLVATPLGRGPDGGYSDIAEADSFEVWADVARHYEVDPTVTAVSGYSMGGFGTFRYLSRWPDLFARGFSVVGAGDEEALPSLRNTPIMSWAAVADELVNIALTEATTAGLIENGLRFTHDLFPAADHLTLATNDEYGPGADFLGGHRVDRNPPHVTYVVRPGEDSERAGAVGDHAYWLSGLRLRGGSVGKIDARSEAFGVGDAPILPVKTSSETLRGGARGPTPYNRRSREWGPAPAEPKRDRLVVKAENISTATIDAKRARLSCSPELAIESNGPLDLRIACPSARRSRCTSRLTLTVPRIRGRRVTSVTVTRRGKVVKRARGSNLRRVKIRRPSRRAFALRVRASAKGKPARRVTVLRRYKSCR